MAQHLLATGLHRTEGAWPTMALGPEAEGYKTGQRCPLVIVPLHLSNPLQSPFHPQRPIHDTLHKPVSATAANTTTTMFLPSLTTLLGLSAWASTTTAQSDACTMYTVELYESADCGSGTADLPQQVFGGYTNRGCTPFGSSVPIRSALVDVGVIWEVRFTDREDCFCDNVLTCPVTSLPQTDGTRKCIDVEGEGAFYVIDDSVQGLCGGV